MKRSGKRAIRKLNRILHRGRSPNSRSIIHLRSIAVYFLPLLGFFFIFIGINGEIMRQR